MPELLAWYGNAQFGQKSKLIYGKFLFGRHTAWINPKRTLETTMTMHAPVLDGSERALLAGNVETLSMLERIAILEINSVQPCPCSTSAKTRSRQANSGRASFPKDQTSHTM